MFIDYITNFLGTKNWIMFRNGSIVSLKVVAATNKDKAIATLEKYGPVQAGTPSGDMCPAKKLDDIGEIWLISYPFCDHIFNMVRIKGGVPDDKDISVNIALAGRTNRTKDADNPVIIHDNSELYH